MVIITVIAVITVIVITVVIIVTTIAAVSPGLALMKLAPALTSHFLAELHRK